MASGSVAPTSQPFYVPSFTQLAPRMVLSFSHVVALAFRHGTVAKIAVGRPLASTLAALVFLAVETRV